MQQTIPKSLHRLNSTIRTIMVNPSSVIKATSFCKSFVTTSRFRSCKHVSSLCLSKFRCVPSTVVSNAVPNDTKILFSQRSWRTTRVQVLQRQRQNAGFSERCLPFFYASVSWYSSGMPELLRSYSASQLLCQTTGICSPEHP
jgi:hypothetical protein